MQLLWMDHKNQRKKVAANRNQSIWKPILLYEWPEIQAVKFTSSKIKLVPVVASISLHQNPNSTEKKHTFNIDLSFTINLEVAQRYLQVMI